MTDYRVLLTARLLRAFGFGFAAVLLGVHLQHRGLSAAQIGLTFSLGLLAGSLYGLGFALASARVGRRAALSVAGIFMALAGLDLALAHAGC
jgi:MFS family permease